MKRITLALLFALPLTAYADDATRHTKAKELLQVLHIDRLIASVVATVNLQTNTITKRLTPPNPTLVQTQAIESFHSKVLSVTESKINWPALQPAYIDLYAKTFTDEELDGILAFYKSPVGVSFLEKSPGLTQQAQKITQDQLVAIQPQLNQIVQDFQKAMTAPPTTPAPAAPAK